MTTQSLGLEASRQFAALGSESQHDEASGRKSLGITKLVVLGDLVPGEDGVSLLRHS